MTGQARGSNKRGLRLIRADDDDNDTETCLEARNLAMTQDRKRLRTSIPETCARVDIAAGASSRIDWTTHFEPMVADTVTLAHPVKTRRHANSDETLLVWMREGRQQEFLDELVRLEGRGDLHQTRRCEACIVDAFDGVAGHAIYTCEDCFGGFLECRACILRTHARLPFHRIQHWEDGFFKRVTLQELGLRLALGPHTAKRPCSNPEAGRDDFTVLHENGIHLVNVDFCGCEQRVARRTQLLRAEIFPSTYRFPWTGATLRLLETFEKLATTGKLSPYEHYNSLLRMTDNTGVDIPKSRYKAYLRITRQFAHLKMMKRAGRGNAEDGVGTTSPGQLAISCPACPRDGVNLPTGWQTFPEDEQYRFMLVLALDANFRLKNLRRLSTKDPGLHTGLAYFVESDAYLKHIARYPRQTDISSCSGFKTLAHAETKNSAGLQCTGVGMSICARHEFIRPRGVGDLQRGERFCNMDYIAFSAVQAELPKLRRLFYSYDIWCQWKIKLSERMKELPEAFRLSETVKLCGGVPKCHSKGHGIGCQCMFCMNIQLGIGRTDGEGIERTWSGVNASAAATKEMLPGGRHDILDRRFGAHNWEKLTRLGHSLHQRLAKANAAYAIHAAAHADFGSLIPEKDLARWTKQIEDWEENPTFPSPYFFPQTYASESAVRTQLAEQERLADQNTMPIHDTSATQCISQALLIEDLQRRIVHLLSSADRDSPAVVKDIQDKRITLQRHLRQFRELQGVYMACSVSILAAKAGSREGDVETEQLILPSALPACVRETGCAQGLAAKEEMLREAQCYDALETIRTMQRTQRSLKAFRHRNLRGQRETGRSFATLHRLQGKTDLAAEKYHTARAALLVLRGPGQWETILRTLKAEDIRALDSQIFDIDSSRNASKGYSFGSGSHTLSWIWLMGGAMDGISKDDMDGAIRVEWLKSRARVQRWREEMVLGMDERTFTLASLEHEASRWDDRATKRSDQDEAGQEGTAALAHRQAYVYRSLRAHFVALWAKPVKLGRQRVPERVDLKVLEDSDDEVEVNDERGTVIGEGTEQAAGGDDMDRTLADVSARA